MGLRLGDDAPNFTAETTDGTINFHEWLGMNHAPACIGTKRERGQVHINPAVGLRKESVEKGIGQEGGCCETRVDGSICRKPRKATHLRPRDLDNVGPDLQQQAPIRERMQPEGLVVLLKPRTVRRIQSTSDARGRIGTQQSPRGQNAKKEERRHGSVH